MNEGNRRLLMVLMRREGCGSFHWWWWCCICNLLSLLFAQTLHNKTAVYSYTNGTFLRALRMYVRRYPLPSVNPSTLFRNSPHGAISLQIGRVNKRVGNLSLSLQSLLINLRRSTLPQLNWAACTSVPLGVKPQSTSQLAVSIGDDHRAAQ